MTSTIADPRTGRYKASGANAVDETGLKDTVEFINISQDDALAYPAVVHRGYPSTVNAHMADTVVPFVRKSLEVNSTILAVFNAKLGLPEGALVAMHELHEKSCSEARVIKSPPMQEMSPERQALGAHTDFGSLVRPSPCRFAWTQADSADRPSCTTGSAACRSTRPAQADGST